MQKIKGQRVNGDRRRWSYTVGEGSGWGWDGIRQKDKGKKGGWNTENQ